MSREVIARIRNGDLAVDFRWNSDLHPLSPLPERIISEPTAEQAQQVKIVAEDLRDGLHGVEEQPSLGSRARYIGRLVSLGIDTVTVGIYAGESNRVSEGTKALLTRIREEYPQVTPIILSLATEESLRWAVECKRANPRLNAIVFMGTAPSRLLVEEWKQDEVLSRLAWAVRETVKSGIEVIGATEHTTQTPPDFLAEIIKTQVENGISYFCVADTIGQARPRGAFRIVSFVKDVLRKMGREDVVIDWHGHRDMENAVANSLAAIAAGAGRIHTVARGIGERAGNTQMESILLNLVSILEEAELPIPWRMEELSGVLEAYNDLVGIPSPSHGPIATRSFETSLGLHTAAMLKAERLAREARQLGEEETAAILERMGRTIYTAVDPQAVGRRHSVRVGPWSGRSTVGLAYLALGGNSDHLPEATIAGVLSTAKKLGRELTTEELNRLLANNHF